jgi:hypothetical protein
MCDPAKLLKDFTYKPGWSFYFNEGTENTPAVILVQMNVADSNSPDEMVDTGMPRVIRDYEEMSDDEFFEWLQRTIGFCEAHERDEWMRYKGKKIFDQHEYPLMMARPTHT